MLCNDCPRNCNVERKYNKGFCRMGEKIKVAKVIKNFMWEEPCLSLDKGVLAIFFSGCNLRCEFCQNYQISHNEQGREFTPYEFASFLREQDYSKYSAVDLITPTHFTSALIEAFSLFKPPIPVVWNSSGYEKEESVISLAPYVDVFLPDFKFYNRQLSKNIAAAEDYFQVAKKAIKKMIEIKIVKFDGELMTQGVIIRHLVLPGELQDSKKILEYLSTLDNPYLSLMSQFTPNGKGIFNRKLYPLEYKSAVAYSKKLGFDKGFVQDISSADDCYIPDF